MHAEVGDWYHDSCSVLEAWLWCRHTEGTKQEQRSAWPCQGVSRTQPWRPAYHGSGFPLLSAAALHIIADQCASLPRPWQVESEVGKGSTFTVWLPVRQPNSNEPLFDVDENDESEVTING